MTCPVQLPLGQRIPDSLHAVSVSLPTMADVRAYEEGDPATIAALQAGYPRFIKHPCLQKLEAYWQELFDKPGQPVWPASSERMARLLEKHLACPAAKFQKHGGVSGLRIPADPEIDRQAKLFLQHVGGLLSSRQAEDYLVREGVIGQPFAEETCADDAEARIQEVVSPWLGSVPAERLILCNCGMNAFYATFQAINEIQAPHGRRSWIKLGWLYADTMHILDKLAPAGARNLYHYNVFDLDALEAELERRPGEFAALITEFPTNPLIQSMDLDRIRELATKHGFYLVIDPTINSAANVDVSAEADIIVTSLTKYAANEGDVIYGAVAVQDRCPKASEIARRIGELGESPYPRDTQRLAAQIGNCQDILGTINRNTRQVVDFLSRHPKVDTLYWACAESSREAYIAKARSPEAVGSMLSFTLKGDMEPFYDRAEIKKGPSFGIKDSLLCPFIYLAHYALINSPEGRRYLQQAGIPPDLLRLSVGAEPIDDILAALETGFAAQK